MGASVAEVNDIIRGDVELIKQANLETVSQMDPVRLFIDECLEPADGGTMIQTPLYAGYKQYCDIKGLSCSRRTTSKDDSVTLLITSWLRKTAPGHKPADLRRWLEH